MYMKGREKYLAKSMSHPQKKKKKKKKKKVLSILEITNSVSNLYKP